MTGFLLVGCADLQSLDTMQPMERKRQGYIHELIQTEERYMDDLQLVLEVRCLGCEHTLGKRTSLSSWIIAIKGFLGIVKCCR